MESKELNKEISEHDTTSNFRLVIVASLRAKQLLRGAKPRIDKDPGRRKHTSIALEEVRRKLVGFVDVHPIAPIMSVPNQARLAELERQQVSVPT
ncbi:MAG TPA: DNA-directed RNA polymerase subunit omega [Pyrinomonadaceae bacterium]|nr:DNA-directed RNA polymerase subunit omega [Pyrinomonadaceae bacterium]